MDYISAFLNNLLTGAGGDGAHFSQTIMAVFVAYVGGIISSLTPCIYPMIPVTVGVVGGMSSERRSDRRWKELVIRVMAYVFGLTMVYSFLGVAAGLGGKIFGQVTNTSGWYMVLGIIMTMAALVMLDVIPFDPEAWWDRIRRHRRRHQPAHHPVHSAATHREMTWLGALVLGVSSGLIASPCTTPVLTAILAYVAKTQSVVEGLLLMIAFSLGLSTILLIIAVFAGAIQMLPRSGMWLKAVKIASGIILLGFAEYLIFKSGKLGGL